LEAARDTWVQANGVVEGPCSQGVFKVEFLNFKNSKTLFDNHDTPLEHIQQSETETTTYRLSKQVAQLGSHKLGREIHDE
jgi:hypothetical protein